MNGIKEEEESSNETSVKPIIGVLLGLICGAATPIIIAIPDLTSTESSWIGPTSKLARVFVIPWIFIGAIVGAILGLVTGVLIMTLTRRRT